MAADPNLKQLGIKVGTVKRTLKEYELYLKEEVEQRAKVARMKADKIDEADIKKQLEVLNDTLTVIPDTRQRMQKYASELRELVSTHYATVEAAVIAAADAPPPDGDKAFEHVRDARLYLGKIANHLNSDCLGASLPEAEKPINPADEDV
mmetsp:Transcript_25784/g.47138  ORF Transcript_25784/g.47138 Transcript_25784/m.47138 type:complete len:150 (+) Transcript_25784:66-515(+)